MNSKDVEKIFLKRCNRKDAWSVRMKVVVDMVDYCMQMFDNVPIDTVQKARDIFPYLCEVSTVRPNGTQVEIGTHQYFANMRR